jgi:hypothetical protein
MQQNRMHAPTFFFLLIAGLGDMMISYRGRYESVYRERLGHIVYIERELLFFF